MTHKERRIIFVSKYFLEKYTDVCSFFLQIMQLTKLKFLDFISRVHTLMENCLACILSRKKKETIYEVLKLSASFFINRLSKERFKM